MRRRFATIMALILCSALVACSSNKGDTGSAEGDQGSGSVTLRFAWWGDQARHDLTMEAIKLYEKNYPNVTIVPEFSGFDGYFDKLSTQAAGNQLPDIFQMNVPNFSSYAKNNLMADLKPYADQGKIDFSNINESVVGLGELNGKVSSIPAGINAIALVYDPAVLQENGFSMNDAEWTWDDFMNMAKSITEKSGMYGGGNIESVNVLSYYYFRTLGSGFFNASGDGLGFEDAQLIDYFNKVSELAAAKAIPTPDIVASIKGMEDDLLVKGQAPFSWRFSNNLSSLANLAGRPLELALLPGPGSDKGMMLRPSLYYSVAENSKQKEEAVKFLDFLINDLDANDILKAERGVPISEKVREHMMQNLNENQKKEFEYISRVEQHSSAADRPEPAKANEVRSALTDVLDRLLFKTLSPEEAATDFKKKASEILGRS